MSDLRLFDPEKDEGKPLFEIVSTETDGVIVTGAAPSEATFEEARAAPWYYLVEKGLDG